MSTEMSARRGGNPGDAHIISDQKSRPHSTLDPADKGLIAVYDGRSMRGAIIDDGRCRLLAFRASDAGLRQLDGTFRTRRAASAAIMRGLR